MQAESMLLEPYYDFQLEIPSGMIGRALTDIQRMNGETGTPQTEGEMTTIEDMHRLQVCGIIRWK